MAPPSRPRRPRGLRLSPDAREALAFLGGLAGMGWLVISDQSDPLFVGAFLAMMGVSIGASWDRRAREKRESDDQPSEKPC